MREGSEGSAHGGEVRRVEIAALARMPEYQMRRDRRGEVVLDRGTVSRYAAAYRSGEALPPVRVAVVAGAPLLVDGWHRVKALEEIGERTVEAVVHRDATARDALRMAATANLAHGLPLSPRQVRYSFRALIRAKAHIGKHGGLKSYREIAEMLGGQVSYSTVRNWMQRDFPKVFRRYSGGDGRGSEPWRDLGPRVDIQAAYTRQAIASAQQAVAAARGVAEPEDRGRIVKALEEALEAVKRGGAWAAEEPADF